MNASIFLKWQAVYWQTWSDHVNITDHSSNVIYGNTVPLFFLFSQKKGWFPFYFFKVTIWFFKGAEKVRVCGSALREVRMITTYCTFRVKSKCKQHIAFASIFSVCLHYLKEKKWNLMGLVIYFINKRKKSLKLVDDCRPFKHHKTYQNRVEIHLKKVLFQRTVIGVLQDVKDLPWELKQGLEYKSS